jgi:hypothetical protein
VEELEELAGEVWGLWAGCHLVIGGRPPARS